MATTLASPMTAGDTSATFNNLGAYTVGNRVLLTIDAHNSSGTETPSAREVVYGEVSAGNTLINMVRAVEGTAQSHAAGAEVIDEVTAAHFRLLHDGLDSEHTATGAHDTALVAMLAGAQTFTGVKTFSAVPLLPANTVEASDIQAGAVTPEKLVTGTGTSWAWQTWTPTLTNISGGTATARYTQIGKTVILRFAYVLAGAGLSGNPQFTLPVTAASYQNEHTLGTTVVQDAGNNVYLGTAVIVGATGCLCRGISTNGSILNFNSTTPFTWGSGDNITVEITYEAA